MPYNLPNLERFGEFGRMAYDLGYSRGRSGAVEDSIKNRKDYLERTEHAEESLRWLREQAGEQENAYGGRVGMSFFAGLLDGHTDFKKENKRCTQGKEVATSLAE